MVTVSMELLEHLERVYVPGQKRVPSLQPGTWDLEIGRRGSVTYVAVGPLPYKRPTRQLLGLASDLLEQLRDRSEYSDCPACTHHHRKGAACYPARRRY